MYVQQVTFEIPPDEMDELQIGGSVDLVLSFLRARLPAERGFVTSRAMYSVDDAKHTLIVFESAWATWEDLDLHRGTEPLETTVLREFGPQIDPDRISVRLFAEAGEEQLAISSR